MLDMEKRINEVFPNALLHTEEEIAFCDAHTKVLAIGSQLVDARTDVSSICADIAIDAADAESLANELASAKSKVNTLESAFQVAMRELDEAREKMYAVSQEVLQAKIKLANARFYIAKEKYLRYDREIGIAQTLMLIEDNDEMIRKLNDAYTLKDAARLEMENAIARCMTLEILRRG